MTIKTLSSSEHVLKKRNSMDNISEIREKMKKFELEKKKIDIKLKIMIGLFVIIMLIYLFKDFRYANQNSIDIMDKFQDVGY